MVDFKWVVNILIFVYILVNKLVKFNVGVILFFIMVKDYEYKFNFLKLFIISFKIMGIFYYKRYEIYEWKLCEVFYKYLMEILCYGYCLKMNIMMLFFFMIYVLDKLLFCNLKFWILILFEWNFNRKNF